MPQTQLNGHTILFYGKAASPMMDAQPKAFFDDPPTYEDEVKKIIPKSKIINLISSYELESPDIPEGSIAYYPVMGEIRYKSRWYFSSHEFMQQLETAEANPNIAYHLIHVDSPGGEAFGCHEMFDALRACKKPTLCLIDRMAASAGYYIASACKKIFASSLFSEIGCIGTMAIVVNDDKFYEKWGYKIHEYYSKFSPKKNKVFNDASDGEGEEYISRFLDPMAEKFIGDVSSARPDISQEAKEGETFYSAEAQAAGLIDGEMSMDETLEYIQKEIDKKAKKANINQPSIDINSINF